jgi:hypothetical protein
MIYINGIRATLEDFQILSIDLFMGKRIAYAKAIKGNIYYTVF